jgi:DNA-binding HxlR family transcriptional regulator
VSPIDEHDAPPAEAAVPGPDAGIEAVVALVGDRWSILLVRALFRGIRRFDDLQSDLGISRPVLAERLKRLQAAGVVERSPYQDRPVRYEYRLTPMGIELSPMLVALVLWGTRWFGDADHTVLVHRPCGTELEQAFWCRTCRTTFGPLALGSRPA